MADNIDEEHLDNPTNNQSENPPDQIISSDDTDAINQNQETENMEVHHHSHSSHGKKNLKSYFWEFLMLFLAVFCGFLAEYQLEHKIEREKGKQYVESFVEDLKTDTAKFSKTINHYEKLKSQLNNLYESYDSILQNQNPTSSLINIIDATHGFSDLIYTDRTLEQLKNAGGLRLLKKEDADSIIKYDAFLRYVLRTESTSMQPKATQVRNTRNEVFVFTKIMDTTFGINKNLPVKLEVVTSDRKLLNKFFMELLVYRGVSEYMSILIKQLRRRGVSLIEHYTLKYHLK